MKRLINNFDYATSLFSILCTSKTSKILNAKILHIFAHAENHTFIVQCEDATCNFNLEFNHGSIFPIMLDEMPSMRDDGDGIMKVKARDGERYVRRLIG